MVPDLQAFQAARNRLAKYLTTTQLRSAPALSRRFGKDVWLKLENEQPTGSFKVRPALNSILSHLVESQTRGVITSSSGNFAQAVAWASAHLKVSAMIVMTRTTAAHKIAATQALGAQVVLCEPTFQARWETTRRLQQETGRLLLHPYDSAETIAGDGTIGLEILEQLPGDVTVLAPASGGGLVAGITEAMKLHRPNSGIIAIQPQLAGAMAASLHAGRRVEITPRPSLADALVAAQPGALPFEICKHRGVQSLLVSEEAIFQATQILFQDEGILAEPAGCMGLAALLSLTQAQGPVPKGLEHTPVVLVVSGGNLSTALHSAITGATKEA